MSKNDGGPAFPHTFESYDPSLSSKPIKLVHTGMSLRDWFAGMIANGLAASGSADTEKAERAYKLADKLIEARKK